MKNKRIPLTALAAILALSAFAAVAVGGAAAINSESVRRKTTLDGLYGSAFYDLCDSVNNLEINLSKLMIAGGNKDCVPLIDDVNAQAELAENSLARLPIGVGEARRTGKYFNQVADWCRSYASVIADGGDGSTFRSQAEDLFVAARSINAQLKELAWSTDGRGLTETVGEGRLLGFSLTDAFGEMENNGIEYPELIYDGPFSDAKKYSFRALDGLDEVDADYAAGVAARVADGLNFVGETSGKTALYEFDGTIADGNSAHVSVTKKGGRVIDFDRTAAVGAVTLGESEARAAAAEFAASLGYEGLTPIWYNSENGVGFVSLAPVENGVTMYTDLVKVKIALGDGTPIGLEATGYCASHRDRSLKASLTESAARSIAGALAVDRVSLAVIPDGENERLCYEIVGGYKGLDYYVYVDAITGETADILRLIDAPQGPVVM